MILPKDDCKLQQAALDAAMQQLKGPATVVTGIGPGASLAWNWLATQTNDKAQAISVGFTLEQPGCETSISDYDIHLPQVLNNELRKMLVGNENGGLSIPVVEVPAGQTTDTVTLFLSGDGGWRDLDRDVAGEMAKMGYPVVGIDTLRYYWQHKSPEQSADHLPEAEQQRVDAIILLAFARSGSFEIHVDGWLGKAGMELDTGPDMAKLPAAKVLCIYGKEEIDESGCTTKTAVGEALQLPGGHHFDENYPALAKRLIDAIDKRQNKAKAE